MLEKYEAALAGFVPAGSAVPERIKVYPISLEGLCPGQVALLTRGATVDQAQSAAEETVVTVSRRTLEEGLEGADLARNFAEWVGVLQREIESGEGVQDGTLMLVGGACVSMLREMQVNRGG
jgi:hypothetical protein